MLKLLFGKAGSGKSYVGRLASIAYGLHFHDADDDLPERFRAAIRNREKVTEEMRVEYAQGIVTAARRLMATHANLCICQALPRDRIRESLLRAIPSIEFVWVDAPEDLIAARLRERPGHLASMEYAASVNNIFEPPVVPHEKLLNGADPAKLRRQMQAIFGRKALNQISDPALPTHGQAIPARI